MQRVSVFLEPLVMLFAKTVTLYRITTYSARCFRAMQLHVTASANDQEVVRSVIVEVSILMMHINILR